VIQIGNLTINILPKADKNLSWKSQRKDKKEWNDHLINMLRAVGLFNVKAPSTSSLKIKPNSILDLYFEMFIKEVEALYHKGLVKKYRKTESNQTALKGSIQFSKHIQKNLIHKERFYVKHNSYDKQHKLHQILFKGLKLLKQINSNHSIQSNINRMIEPFPQMSDIKVIESTFESIHYDRKTETYKNAINIAKLILLNYHPDVSKGKNDVLALMFDMNELWEQFVFVALRKYNDGNSVTAQTTKNFWKPEKGRSSYMQPDIVLNKGNKENCVVLDTKWKNINTGNPKPDDLRQLFVYHDYFESKKVALVYPGSETKQKGVHYYDSNSKVGDKECSVITLTVEKDIKAWQKSISASIFEWIEK
jgi:5-methylcytosine-specific restriction enzyme subunit McrC